MERRNGKSYREEERRKKNLQEEIFFFFFSFSFFFLPLFHKKQTRVIAVAGAQPERRSPARHGCWKVHLHIEDPLDESAAPRRGDRSSCLSALNSQILRDAPGWCKEITMMTAALTAMGLPFEGVGDAIASGVGRGDHGQIHPHPHPRKHPCSRTQVSLSHPCLRHLLDPLSS